MALTKRDLRTHKQVKKALAEPPSFKHQARNKLPPPFKKLGGPRIFSTGLLPVSDDHLAFLFWRDGPLLTDRAFYGYLFCKLAKGISPLLEFHWHPSHKDIHVKTPCGTTVDYTDRQLPGAPELQLATPGILDPKQHADRERLLMMFCDACGIALPDADPMTEALWK